MNNVFFKLAMTGWVLTIGLGFVVKSQGDFNENSKFHKSLIVALCGSFIIGVMATIVSIWSEY